MRNLILILIIFTSVQSVSAQACGIYRLNYEGVIKSELNNTIKIKLPTTMFLHNLELENSDLAFMETEVKDGEFYVKTKSHLTSHLFSKGQDLKEYYMSKRDFFPVILISEKNGITTETRIDISWNNVNLYTVKDKGFGNAFAIKLCESTEEISSSNKMEYIVFDSIQYDLGVISNENAKLIKHFTFLGTEDDEPLMIIKTWTNDPHFICQYPKEPLEKNKKYAFEVCFYHGEKKGKFKKSMGFIFSNGDKATITFTGEYQTD